MKKKYYNFLSNCFIPNMNKLGYTEKFFADDSFKLNYHEKGEVIFFIKDKYSQIFLKFEDPKLLIALKHLALLSDNILEKEKMEKAEDAFFYDNYYEFEGLFNYVFQILKQRGDFVFSNEGYNLLREKIEEKKQYNESLLKTNIQNKINDLLDASKDWKTKIRFTEDCYHQLSAS